MTRRFSRVPILLVALTGIVAGAFARAGDATGPDPAPPHNEQGQIDWRHSPPDPEVQEARLDQLAARLDPDPLVVYMARANDWTLSPADRHEAGWYAYQVLYRRAHLNIPPAAGEPPGATRG